VLRLCGVVTLFSFTHNIQHGWPLTPGAVVRMMNIREKIHPHLTRVRKQSRQRTASCLRIHSRSGPTSPIQLSIGMARPTAFLHLVGYALFSVPPLLLLIYLITQFPRPQEPLHIYPSLASVPRSNRVWEIYDEDYFPGGGYAVLPYGRVSLHFGLSVRATHLRRSGTVLAHGPRGWGEGKCRG